MSTAVNNRRGLGWPLSLLLATFALFALLAGLIAQPAFAGSLSISSTGTHATISAPTSVKYKRSSMGEAMWNHGTFYVYFFEGASNISNTMVKTKGSDIKTKKTELDFSDGVSWAKVHVAAVDSSTASNGGKYTRLKSSSGANLKWSSYLESGKRFYVWISETGGDGGVISLRGASSKTVYAEGKQFKNAKTITVTSQPAADRYTQGASESDYNSVINIPFRWEGKDKSQVAYSAFSSRGIGDNESYHTFYRMNWKQYSDGTTYSGYSPYKLQHGVTTATNIWTSINLASVGILITDAFTDATLKKKTGSVFRNNDTHIVCCLKKPKEQIKIDSDGGTLQKDETEYSGSSVKYKKVFCETKVPLPATGTKQGRDGSTSGYVLAGYTWKAGTNRKTFSSTKPSSSKKFIAFDQAEPESVELENAEITACNNWQIPDFGSDNLEDASGKLLYTPTVANATYKAMWEALPFKIHYIVNGSEIDTEEVEYDSPYKLSAAPSGSNGWTVQKADGSAAANSGYMPSQDIYAYAETSAPSTVRYYIDGKLSASYSIPFGESPLASTYTNKSSGGIEYCDDGIWTVSTGVFSATYKEHYNVPVQTTCVHEVDDSYYVEGYTVSDGYWTVINGKAYYIDKSYEVAGHWVKRTKKEHDYDVEDDYSYYSTKTYSVTYGIPGNPNGGTWNGWFTDANCTSPAASAYSFSQGDCLSFYSYTTHTVSYIINEQTALEEDVRYGSVVNPYAHGEELNAFGGSLKCWYLDSRYNSKAPNSITVGSDDIMLHGYTKHVIHFWMDAGAKETAIDGDRGEAGEDEIVDDGTVDKAAGEISYCLHEIAVRYGDMIELPDTTSISGTVTRPGCEDWATHNGIWYTDAGYSNAASNTVCTGDTTFYSFNLAELSYGLSNYAEELESSQALMLSGTNTPVSLSSFLPGPKLYRYGTSVAIEGDGSVWWVTSGGLSRSATSVKGGFKDKNATGSSIKSIVLLQSTCIYKDWAQGLFDGIVTK